ncbi:electron transfer flavoprotein subunit beta/FixA family protein [Borborobacter arsenicus]|uniref:electron transfer flavoprotein subunit beta/FixA family protein n=1 Tax=Borborobacter arsenicus TaxID=1851146 RepID=UPI0014042F5E|nr:electron transfer flavoprotein subunit beta [Pseudaminobacter arsenicus]
MNIVVILQTVPDSAEELTLADGVLDWDEAPLRLNEFDDHALEEAVLAKEEAGATVIALALESAGDRVLQTAVARGADRAVKLIKEVPLDASARMVAPLMAEAARKLGADLVVTGVQAPGDIFGQLAPFTAAELAWPLLGGAVGIDCSADAPIVAQEFGGGRSAQISVTLPAVVGVQAARRPPRYVSGSKLRQAVQSASIEKLDVAAELADEPGKLVTLHSPHKTTAISFLDDDPVTAVDQIVEIFRQRGIVGGGRG